MTADFTIRPARPEDHPAVARELAEYLSYIGDTLDPHGLDHDIAHWQEEYDGVSGVLLLVEDAAGLVVGTAAVRVLEPGTGELKRMWLRPAVQGQGLGRRLLDASLAEARRLGCRALRLDSQTKLEAAVRLYRANGFRDIPRYNDNRRADVWMERAL
ncbi:MAG TPA: GNAT family N-acetyltransferase [Candidatus Bathyarchaeia archaeon]|nr:GNAT family N-acetyltransferase [Candidatus Bathyarchaeia archaeon]